MSIREKIPFVGAGNPYEDLVEGLQNVKGDYDALALLPYDDGTFFLKPANFDKDLIGGQGGYETDDGDKIAMDGDGQPVKDLFGVPMLLAVDPTEHAAAVEPIKALVAQKNNIGEYIRVDRKGNVIEVGEALEAAEQMADLETVTPVGAEIEGTMVEDKLNEMGVNAAQASDAAIQRAMEQLADEGDLTKVFDLAPPAGLQTNGDGEIELDEASHIAVDQSKAADLLPKTTSTTELNVALDKARMEEHDEDKLKSYIMYGFIMGFVSALITAVVMGAVLALV